MRYEIELTHAELIHTAVVRSRVPRGELARFVPAACCEVWSFIRAARVPGPGRHVALYLDAQGSVEIGAEVAAPFTGNDRVGCSHLSAGRVAHTVHFGPYPRLAEAHEAIREWCAGHGHGLTGVGWELYGHWEERWNADPSKIRTDVFQLLAEVREGR